MLYIYVVPKHGSYCGENLHSPTNPVTAACLETQWNGHSVASYQKREFVNIWEESGKRKAVDPYFEVIFSSSYGRS